MTFLKVLQVGSLLMERLGVGLGCMGSAITITPRWVSVRPRRGSCRDSNRQRLWCLSRTGAPDKQPVACP